ncbi:MAG: NCS2 family permease [Rikenellaceae bacterium]
MLKKLFGYDSSTTSVRTELMAGLTTFLTMSYILAVNPNILSATGMDKGALFTATALASAVATYILAFYAKMPLAQAPAMGVNAFFAYTLVINMGYSWQTALTITFIEGIIFIILTVLNIRDKIINCIPISLRYAITVGIGFLIGFIGLKNAGIIQGDEGTLVTLSTFDLSKAIAAFGILLSAILVYKNIRGSLFYSIIICTIISIMFGITEIPENFTFFSKPASLEPIFFKFDFSSLLSLDVLTITFILVFMDMFNTIGTIVGTASQAGIMAKDGSIPHIKETLMSDALGTSAGAILGTSTVTTFVESSAGIAEGGRSGLTAFSTATLFLLALFLAPVFTIIPSIATTGALVIVGAFMMASVKNINYSDLSDTIPSFITILTMIVTYSIAEGIVFGLVSYTVINLFTKQYNKIHPTLYIISILLIIRYFIM